MRGGQWLAAAQRQLAEAGIMTSRLDALILLEDALGQDRTQLIARPEIILPPAIQNVLNSRLARRVRHEPLAYIRGKAEFYGREFIVSPAVLVPRPESETMIDMLKKLFPAVRDQALKMAASSSPQPVNKPTTLRAFSKIKHDRKVNILDVGTGSGALGITAFLEVPDSQVELSDIDNSALKVAHKNVIKHTTSLKLFRADLLPDTEAYQILLCNLPYVPDNFNINQAAKFEPKIALFAGSDGLDLYRQLFQKVAVVRNKPLLILTESFPQQHLSIQHMASDAGYTHHLEDDYIQAHLLRNPLP